MVVLWGWSQAFKLAGARCLHAIYCKTARTCPSLDICRLATDRAKPGVVARRAFCRFLGWGMSELFGNTCESPYDMPAAHPTWQAADDVDGPVDSCVHAAVQLGIPLGMACLQRSYPELQCSQAVCKLPLQLQNQI